MEFRRLRGDAAAGYTPVDSAAAVEAFGPALLAVDETLILLHPPLHLAGVSTVMERARQQNDSLTDGYRHCSAPTSTSAICPEGSAAGWSAAAAAAHLRCISHCSLALSSPCMHTLHVHLAANQCKSCSYPA